SHVLPGGFGLSPLRGDGHSRLSRRLWDWLLSYYDVVVPFLPPAHPRMHAALVVAVFGFCLALALAIAARKPAVASLVVAAGVAWPATLIPAHNDLRLGGFIRAAVLLLFAGMAPGGGFASQPA